MRSPFSHLTVCRRESLDGKPPVSEPEVFGCREDFPALITYEAGGYKYSLWKTIIECGLMFISFFFLKCIVFKYNLTAVPNHIPYWKGLGICGFGKGMMDHQQGANEIH